MRYSYNKLISLSAIVALAGYILSGPVSFILIKLIKPQPAWIFSAVFAEHYHTLQDLPYYFGFFLIGGMLMLSAGHYLNYNESDRKKKFHLLAAVGWTIVFCTLISFNYICQTTFVRNLALNYKPEYDSAVSSFSMANPLSFCWANEMWGYAFLGIATWLMSGYYQRRNDPIRFIMIANGILSLISVAWTIVNVSWVMTVAGLVAYFLWNVLMIVMMLMIYSDARKMEAMI